MIKKNGNFINNQLCHIFFIFCFYTEVKSFSDKVNF